MPYGGGPATPEPPSSATRHLPQVPSGGHRRSKDAPIWPHREGAATQAAVHAEAGEAAGSNAQSNSAIAGAGSANIMFIDNVNLTICQQLLWRDYTHQVSPDLMVLLW